MIFLLVLMLSATCNAVQLRSTKQMEEPEVTETGVDEGMGSDAPEPTEDGGVQA